MSFARDQCVIMSKLQIDLAREFASVPPQISPSDSLPTKDTNHLQEASSEPVLIYVNSITGDGS